MLGGRTLGQALGKIEKALVARPSTVSVATISLVVDAQRVAVRSEEVIAAAHAESQLYLTPPPNSRVPAGGGEGVPGAERDWLGENFVHKVVLKDVAVMDIDSQLKGALHVQNKHLSIVVVATL